MNKALPGVVTPSLLPVIPAEKDQLIREMQEFKQPSAFTAPFVSYVNHLYIYPESLNLNNRGGSVGGKPMNTTAHVPM